MSLCVFGWKVDGVNNDCKSDDANDIEVEVTDTLYQTALPSSATVLGVNHCLLIYKQSSTESNLNLLFNDSLSCFYKQFISDTIEEFNKEDVENEVQDNSSSTRRDRKVLLAALTENMVILVDQNEAVNNFGGMWEGRQIHQVVHVMDFMRLTKRTFDFPQGQIASIAASESHAIFCTTDGRGFSFGKGKHGQLGLGPLLVDTVYPQQLAFPNNEFVRIVATGNHHSCCITGPHGYVYSFGCSSYGRLGLEVDNSRDCVFSPTLIEDLVGIGELLPNGDTQGASLISCGQWHSIVVANGTNDVFGWGWNKFGQLGTVGNREIVSEPQRLSVLDDESLLGEDFDGPNRIIKVCCGSSFTILLTAGKRMIFMGTLNSHNQNNRVSHNQKNRVMESGIDKCKDHLIVTAKALDNREMTSIGAKLATMSCYSWGFVC